MTSDSNIQPGIHEVFVTLIDDYYDTPYSLEILVHAKDEQETEDSNINAIEKSIEASTSVFTIIALVAKTFLKLSLKALWMFLN